jgi:hypothetical protein
MTSALDVGEWLAWRFYRFPPTTKTPGTNWIVGWMSRRAGLDAVKRKILHCLESNPGFKPVARRYIDWAIPAPPIMH